MPTDTTITKQTPEDVLRLLNKIFNDIPLSLISRFQTEHSVNIDANKQMTGSVLGRCRHRGERDDGVKIATVRLSAFIDPRELEETIRHELAHVTNRKFRSGHGPAWKEEAVLWGAIPEPTSSLPNRVNIFDVTCPWCSKVSPFPSIIESVPFIFVLCDCGERIHSTQIKKYKKIGTTQTLDSGDHGRIDVDIRPDGVYVSPANPKLVQRAA